MTNTRIATRIAAVTLTALAFGLAAPSAQAAPVSSTLSVDTTQPGALTIAGHTGLPVTVWTKGASAQTKRPAGSAPVTFANLIPGRAYDVYVGEDKAVRVTTSKATTVVAAPAQQVTLTAGPIAGSMHVTWQLPLPKGTKVANVRYRIAATSPTAAPVELTVKGTNQAILTGLDPKAVYAVTVTATEGTAKLGSVKVQMTTTVADLPAPTDETADASAARDATNAETVKIVTVAPQQAASDPAPAPAPAPGPAPAPAPGPAPKPATRTIYVCPDGFSEAGDLCQQTKAYTFHDVTTTSPYTYHQVFVKTGQHFVGVARQWDGACVGGTDYGDSCGYWEDEGYNTNVKDAPPAGYSDNGSAYSKTEQVKDDLPAGYSDNGSAWVKTAAKIAKEVPA